MTHHGTNNGYTNHGCREECCRRAHANYRKRLEWDTMRGLPRIVSAVGVRRRVEALRALGWSGAAIAREVGTEQSNLSRLLAVETMTRSMHDRFIAAYERMVDQPVAGTAQTISAALRRADRLGYHKPDAWLNIDDPDERPDPGYTPSRPHTDLDPVVVDRILAGDMTLARTATKAERVEVVRRWGGSLAELERRSSWNVGRYVEREAS